MTIEAITLCCGNVEEDTLIHVFQNGVEIYTGDLAHLILDGYGERTVWLFSVTQDKALEVHITDY